MENRSPIRWVSNDRARKDNYERVVVKDFSEDMVKGVRDFHRGFAEYSPTPLHRLDGLARYLGVKGLWVKDESQRFGLNAFKVLGGSYAIGRYMAELYGVQMGNVPFERFKELTGAAGDGNMLFVTATDGNHGRGIAWAANRLGQRSVIFLPRGSAEARVRNIQKEGAKAHVLDMNYDDAVRYARDYADRNNGIFVQDTAWEGYTEIPGWIMQGYSTIAHELTEQLEAGGADKPTHLFLQAGVGSFAASIQAFFAERYGTYRPVTAIVEPDRADCIFKCAQEDDGKVHTVVGDLDTIMAGLACGEPNTVAWEILRDYSDMFFSCPDYVAARGTRILANPLSGDPLIVSGESGSVGVGLLSLLLEREEYGDVVRLLDLNRDSNVVFISTEGDTDPVGYRKIIWDGLCPTPR
ncbi:MAG: diaminopropionate ammonia-lyase [Clostridia bacterium]|jgi:diaminopropionate ammonia-lyase|nr:diaminopropionate ammonia-lyase [Clostridiales bacterium]